MPLVALMSPFHLFLIPKQTRHLQSHISLRSLFQCFKLQLNVFCGFRFSFLLHNRTQTSKTSKTLTTSQNTVNSVPLTFLVGCYPVTPSPTNQRNNNNKTNYFSSSPPCLPSPLSLFVAGTFCVSGRSAVALLNICVTCLNFECVFVFFVFLHICVND